MRQLTTGPARFALLPVRVALERLPLSVWSIPIPMAARSHAHTVLNACVYSGRCEHGLSYRAFMDVANRIRPLVENALLWRRLEVNQGHKHVPLILLTCVLLHNICMDYAVPVENLEPVSPAHRLMRTSEGQTYQGRRFDLETSDTREAIITRLAHRGVCSARQLMPRAGPPMHTAALGRTSWTVVCACVHMVLCDLTITQFIISRPISQKRAFLLLLGLGYPPKGLGYPKKGG